MLFSRNLFLGGIFFIFLFSNLFAKELKLIKKEVGDTIEFFYEFYDFSKKQQTVIFELKKDLIQQSKKEIPNLEILNQKIHTELPRIAYQVSQEHFQPIEDDYYYHLLDIQQTASQAKRDLKENFEIIYNCPKKIINYDFEFVKNRKFSYKIQSKTKSCTFEINTQKAYQDLIQSIENKIQNTKNSLPSTVIYQIKFTNEGFQIHYEIPAGFTRSKHQKILQTIQKTQENIKILEENFQENQKILDRYFQQIVEFHKNFIAQIKQTQSKILQNILQVIASKQKEEYRQYYLKVEKTKQGNSISPDYEELIWKYKPLMEDIAFALNDNNLDQRALANKILNFLQSISYNDLQQRDLEYFTGFFTPPTLFDKNQGDCDSKSVAFLSIAKNLFSNTKAILVLIPGHAFIGLELATQETDQKFEYNGIHYVLAEVAGPAILPFGTISTKSKIAIKKKEIDQIIIF